MAFQTGTRVDPRLGALDFSGFTNAATIQAQAMANLGNQIGGAITKYATNKKKKEEQGMRYETILPYTTDLFGTEQGIEMAKQFSLDPKVGSQIIEFVGMQQDQQAVNKAISANTDTEGKINWSGVLPAYIELGGRDPGMVTGLTAEAKKADNSMFEPEIITLGEGDNAVKVIRTSSGQVQLLQEKGEPGSLPADVRSYEYFYDLGIKRGLSKEDADKDARALVFGDGDGASDILAKFLTDDGAGASGGTGTNNETKTETETETDLNRKPRRRPKNKPNDPLKVENNLSEEERERLEELRAKKDL